MYDSFEEVIFGPFSELIIFPINAVKPMQSSLLLDGRAVLCRTSVQVSSEIESSSQQDWLIDLGACATGRNQYGRHRRQYRLRSDLQA